MEENTVTKEVFLFNLIKSIQTSLSNIILKENIYRGSYLEELEARNKIFLSFFHSMHDVITKILEEYRDLTGILSKEDSEKPITKNTKLSLETETLANSFSSLIENLFLIFIDYIFIEKINGVQFVKSNDLSFKLNNETENQLGTLTELLYRIDRQINNLVNDGGIVVRKRKRENLDLADSISFTDKENFKPSERPNLEDVLDEVLIEG